MDQADSVNPRVAGTAKYSYVITQGQLIVKAGTWAGNNTWEQNWGSQQLKRNFAQLSTADVWRTKCIVSG